MPSLHLLGTGAARSDAHRTTTMLGLVHQQSVLLVDCGGDVVQRALAAGLELEHLDGLILTHEHPDHISGFPLFMERIWLLGRRIPLPVFGPAATLDKARRLFEVFDTSGWKGLPAIDWRHVPMEADTVVLDEGGWTVTAAPVDHGVPALGYRFEAGGRAMAYSGDTAPSEAVQRLAEGVDLLVHEATGSFGRHSSAAGAARIARDSRAGRLVLVHLPPGLRDEDLIEARSFFPRVELGEEGGIYEVREHRPWT
jgi:ribonuclease Z